MADEKKNHLAKVAEFIDYVLDFYGPDSELYPELAVTRQEVLFALGAGLVGNRWLNGRFDGDSVDRELIRDLVLEIREEA